MDIARCRGVMTSISAYRLQPESKGLSYEEVLEFMAYAPAPSTTVETTLYDLVSALCDELEDEEEELVLPILVHLLNSGRIKFIDGHRKYKVTCS